MWLVCRLSIYGELVENDFEFQLILEYQDNSPCDVIDINSKDNNDKCWLSLERQEAPFNNLSRIDIPNKEELSLFVSCFINVDRLQSIKSKLAYIYLWSKASNKNINLETMYLPQQLNKVRTYNFKKNMFLQLYPEVSEVTPSKRYEYLENLRNDSGGLSDLLDLIEEKSAHIIESPHEENSHKSEILNCLDEVSLWEVFSAQDLDDLIEGFKDWQRVHGKNDLTDQIPPSLVAKMGQRYTVAFWTSGQGVSNMVRDDNPPRHTMLISLIQSSGEHGIGYCIQKPTSLDRTWSHQKWHRLIFNDSEILEASLIETK